MTSLERAAQRAGTVRIAKGFDAIVVGGGATGGLAVSLLCEAGLDVLLLDAGWRPPLMKAPFRRTLSDAIGWVADPRSVHFLPPQLVRYGRAALRLAGRRRQPIQSRCYAWERAPGLFVDDLDQPYETADGTSFSWLRVQAIGGRMVVPGHGRQYYRLTDRDFAGETAAGTPFPVTAAEMAPWYEAVERRIDLHGTRDGIPAAPDSVVASPVELNADERSLRSMLLKCWPKLDIIPGRYASPFDGVALAAATGRLTLRRGALATRVDVGADGRAGGVHWHDRETGEERAARARLIFLCAGALETTRLLLCSGESGGPDGGLDPRSGMLGRNLMDHVLVRAEGEGGALECEAYSPPDGRCLFAPDFAGEAANGDRRFGVQLYRSPGLPGRSYFTAVAFGEMMPSAENRVTLHPTRRDSFGRPVLRIDARHRDGDLLLGRAQTRALREIVRAAGVSSARVDEAPAAMGTAVHECGTARMGNDPSTSVLNPRNECWGARGLYVTDGSALPAQGTQNPTLTLMALTARACADAVASV